MKLLLKIRYNGRNYCGFQVQPNGIAIQQVLTDACTKLFGISCSVTGCSRTDSGVHALGFCAAVSARDESVVNWCRIPTGKIHRALNVLLPSDIAVSACAEVPDDFHPRYNVKSKMYVYRISDAPFRDPFLYGCVYHAPRRITPDELNRMAEVTRLFVGSHNFAGFMSSGSKIVDTTRTVFHAEVTRDSDDLIVFSVEADGFLYNMVRIMSGTLIECAYGRKSIADVETAIREGNRSFAGFTAPPEGLYLHTVRYDRKIYWQCE